jgi:hypothetical protein
MSAMAGWFAKGNMTTTSSGMNATHYRERGCDIAGMCGVTKWYVEAHIQQLQTVWVM